MHAIRWTVFLSRQSVWLAARILSSRLWAVPALFVLLSLYGGDERLAGTVMMIGGGTWLLARRVRSSIGRGRAPERPFAPTRQKPVKERPAPVAGSLAVAKDSPSVEIARLRLPPNLQALMVQPPARQR